MPSKKIASFWVRLSVITKKLMKREDAFAPIEQETFDYYTKNIKERSNSTLNFLVDQPEFKTLMSTTDIKSSLKFAYTFLLPPMSDLTSLPPQPPSLLSDHDADR
jgi:hypothetical protein